MTNIQRQHKLHSFKIPIDSKYIELFKFVESKFSELQEFNSLSLRNWVFFMDLKGICVLQYFKGKKALHINHDVFLEVFKNADVNEQDMNLFLQKTFTDKYGFEISSVGKYWQDMLSNIEKEYNWANQEKIINFEVHI